MIPLYLTALEFNGYTDNPLQIAVLNLFVTLKSRFPNLVIGAITRDSVKKALANGITADQVSTPHDMQYVFADVCPSRSLAIS